MFSTIFLTIAAGIVATNGQLAFRQDANTNTFSIQTPSSQTTFTRYFGGQHGSLLEGAETRQQQQVLPAPQGLPGYSYNTPSGQEEFNLPQQYTQQQPAQQFAQQAQPQQQPQFTQDDIAAYFQQQQALNEQQQYQQQGSATQQQYALPQQFAGQQQYYQSQPQQQQPQAAASQQYTQTQQAPQSIVAQFSPSNEVSQVKFSSGGLNYNF